MNEKSELLNVIIKCGEVLNSRTNAIEIQQCYHHGLKNKTHTLFVIV